VPYAFEARDARRFGLPVRRDVSVRVLDRVLRAPLRRFHDAGRAANSRLLQAQIEVGERVVADFMTAMFRTLIPMVPAGIVSIAILIYYIPNLGLLVLVGGGLDVLITVCINRALAARFRMLQHHDNERRSLHLAIFSDYDRSHALRDDVVGEYDDAYRAYAAHGVDTWVLFQRLTLARGLVVNVVNALVWGIGIAYLYGGGFSLGYFLMFTSWSTRVVEFFYTCLNIQKQWIETRPAMEIFFRILDQADATPALHTESSATAVAAAGGTLVRVGDA
jgi:ABC-type bacteriocin/lantibiotic exporter with double-glycine peptidase domain